MPGWINSWGRPLANHGLEGLHPNPNIILHLTDRFCEVGKAKKRFEIEVLTIVHVSTVEAEDSGLSHGETGPLEDIILNGHVVEIGILDGRTQLHLDQIPGVTTRFLQNIGTDPYVIPCKCTFVDHRDLRPFEDPPR